MNRMNFGSLEEWLQWIAAIHPQEMVLGLERVKVVAERLGLKQPACPLIIVGGTNGKGSCVATLEKIYSLQGYRTGVFTSPILYRHNELLRIQEQEVADSFFCEAYTQIEAVRKEVLLTAFEYHTLAVLAILSRHVLDLWILEVGLGGRLDAVNILDADLALIASIGLDHIAWLGNTRELIGHEKAGIFRSERPVVCGDAEPPFSLEEQAKKLASPFYCQGRDFHYSQEETAWHWQGKKNAYRHLPFSQLACQNLATSLMAIEVLHDKLPVSEATIYQGLEQLTLPGRIEIKPGSLTTILDVAHNPAAVTFLADRLRKLTCFGKTRAVFSMLADKDLPGSLHEIKNQIDDWYVAPLPVKRGASMEKLRAAFQTEKIASVQFYETLQEAHQAAKKASKDQDRLLVFGSFHTVAALRDRRLK